MLCHQQSFFLAGFQILLQPYCHFLQTKFTISIQIQWFKGLYEFWLVVCLIDKIDDEDEDSILYISWLDLPKFLHVQKSIYHEIAFNLLFFLLFQILFEPIIVHHLRHR